MGLSDLVVPPWLKLGIKLLPYAVIALLAVGLTVTRATLHDVRLTYAVAQANEKAAQEADKEADAEKAAKASQDYAERIQNIQPIILHNKETVREYSQTPAGAAPCLSTDRVSGINESRRELFSAPEARDTPVLPDTAKPKP